MTQTIRAFNRIFSRHEEMMMKSSMALLTIVTVLTAAWLVVRLVKGL